MSLRRYSSSRPPRRGGGIPAWLIFLVGIALVFGTFYLWDGLQRFFRTGGLSVAETTQQAVVVSTATAERIARGGESSGVARTPLPSATPLPECQDFRVVAVTAPTALVREFPNPNARIVDAFADGTIVCVLYREGDSEYFAIDSNPTTRRFEIAFMHESVLEAVNPTPTPSATMTPPPTITPVPTNTLAPGVTPSPTPTLDSAQPTLPPAAPPATEETDPLQSSESG
jgi:hypothetical protein